MLTIDGMLLQRAQALLVLASVRHPQRAPGARLLVKQARELLAEAADPGMLPALLERTERTLDSAPRREAQPAEPLTDRELTVLRLLPTGLSQREIGGELYAGPIDRPDGQQHRLVAVRAEGDDCRRGRRVPGRPGLPGVELLHLPPPARGRRRHRCRLSGLETTVTGRTNRSRHRRRPDGHLDRGRIDHGPGAGGDRDHLERLPGQRWHGEVVIAIACAVLLGTVAWMATIPVSVSI